MNKTLTGFKNIKTKSVIIILCVFGVLHFFSLAEDKEMNVEMNALVNTCHL